MTSDNPYLTVVRRESGPFSFKILLYCGMLSSPLYLIGDLLGGMIWSDYSFITQTVSELSAINAPSRPFMLPLGIAYSLLIIAFGSGILKNVGYGRAVRFAGAMIASKEVLGFFALLYAPMHLRGDEKSLSDVMHIVLTSIGVLCILLGVGFGSSAGGRGFRIYSWLTLVLMVVFGVMAGSDGQLMADDLPTPWLGIKERVNIYLYMIWIMVFAGILMKTRKSLLKTV